MKTYTSVAKWLFQCLAIVIALSYDGYGQTEYTTLNDLSYRTGSQTDYQQERCKLDLYYPTDQDSYATIVWFHGGGMKFGQKFIPEELKKQGVAVVAVNYRLYPKVKAPAYIDDAAASTAWVRDHISEYGGDPSKIYVSGHSAGGYLATMLALDTTYLKTYDMHPDEIAGYVPFSGHSITHMTVREEMGISGTTVRVDKYAPLAHIKKDTKPILFITGDRELELLGRYEETAYMWRMMKLVGNENVELMELDGFNHGNMYKPALFLLLDFIKKMEKSK